MSTPNDSPALSHQSKHYPARFRGRVPRIVRMATTVAADFPMILMPEWRNVKAVKDEQYPVWVNSHGAVSAIMPSEKQQLGLKPDEFDVIEWHETEGIG